MIVVDSSVVVAALAALPDTSALRSRLARERLHAPSYVDIEVVSAVRGLTIGGRLSEARAEDLLSDYADLPVRRWELADPLRRRAFRLRDNLSAYGAAYVALAEALDCPLVTRDARLARAPSVHDALVEVL